MSGVASGRSSHKLCLDHQSLRKTVAGSMTVMTVCFLSCVGFREWRHRAAAIPLSQRLSAPKSHRTEQGILASACHQGSIAFVVSGLFVVEVEDGRRDRKGRLKLAFPNTGWGLRMVPSANPTCRSRPFSRFANTPAPPPRPCSTLPRYVKYTTDGRYCLIHHRHSLILRRIHPPSAYCCTTDRAVSADPSASTRAAIPRTRDYHHTGARRPLRLFSGSSTSISATSHPHEFDIHQFRGSACPQWPSSPSKRPHWPCCSPRSFLSSPRSKASSSTVTVSFQHVLKAVRPFSRPLRPVQVAQAAPIKPRGCAFASQRTSRISRTRPRPPLSAPPLARARPIMRKSRLGTHIHTLNRCDLSQTNTQPQVQHQLRL